VLVGLGLLEVDGLVISRNFHAHILSVQSLSSLFLNTLVDGASTTCCGNAFQQLITLVLNNDFRTVERTTSSNILVNCGCLCGQLKNVSFSPFFSCCDLVSFNQVSAKLSLMRCVFFFFFFLFLFLFFLVRHHDDDEVDDISCLHAVLSLQLATASLNGIFRSSKSSLMFSRHFFA